MTCDPGQAGWRRSGGFTVAEAIIVLVALGLMVGIVIADFTSTTTDPRLCRLTGDVQLMRDKIQRYAEQHKGTRPMVTKFERQMIGTTDIAGDTDGSDFGPYLLRIPPNPFTGKSTVGSGPIGSSDWYYDQATGEFRANDSDAHAAY